MTTTTTSAKTYLVRDEGCDYDLDGVDNIRDAKEAAREHARGGDYGDLKSTIWVEAHVVEVEDGYVDTIVATVTVAIDPTEPECEAAGEHDWHSPHEIVGGCKENPGVWGHGGGVVITEVCACCGCERVTDTWAQRSDTGEQGLTSVSYTEHAHPVDRS